MGPPSAIPSGPLRIRNGGHRFQPVRCRRLEVSADPRQPAALPGDSRRVRYDERLRATPLEGAPPGAGALAHVVQPVIRVGAAVTVSGRAGSAR